MNLRPPDYSLRNDEEELIVEVPENIRKTFKHRNGIDIPNKYHIMKKRNTHKNAKFVSILEQLQRKWKR